MQNVTRRLRQDNRKTSIAQLFSSVNQRFGFLLPFMVYRLVNRVYNRGGHRFTDRENSKTEAPEEPRRPRTGGHSMNTEKIWIDVTRCSGCGDCVEICPEEAIALINQKAIVDHESCTGCGVCIDSCPEDAIEPVIQAEIVQADEQRAITQSRPSPLVRTAGTAVVVAGTGLLMKAAAGVVRAVGRWLLRRASSSRASSSPSGRLASSRQPGRQETSTSGRQTRHRRRGG